MKEDNTVGLYSYHFGVYFAQNVVVFSEFSICWCYVEMKVANRILKYTSS